MRVKVYSVKEFLHLEEKKGLQKIDRVITHLKRNKKMYIKVVAMLAIMGFVTNTSYANGLGNIDVAGNKILTVVRRIGYWVILVKGMSEIVKNAMNGDMHSLGRTVMLYVMIYGALFFFPWALRLVEGVF